MKPFSFIPLFALSAVLGGCVFMDTGVISYGKLGNGYEEGVTAFNTGDFPFALKMLEPVAENGNVDAQYLAGLIYLNGLTDGQRNSYAAEKWLSMAASAGHTAAQEQLAFLYRDPSAPLYNPLAAYRWFEIVVAEKPEYKATLGELRWALTMQGKLAEAEDLNISVPSYVYHGSDYNALFPPR